MSKKEQDALEFENAMFGGINYLIHYYEPHIAMLAKRNEDKSRATLGEFDLRQHCRLTLHKCWEKQRKSSSIKNFDMMAKQAMQNTIRTIVGKEYCHKRGRCKLEMFSELERPTFSDNESDYESILFQRSVASSYEQGFSFEQLLSRVEEHLDPALQRTFDCVAEQSFKYLDPQNLNPVVRSKLARSLQTSEQQLLTDITSIQFILRGFSHELR